MYRDSVLYDGMACGIYILISTLLQTCRNQLVSMLHVTFNYVHLYAKTAYSLFSTLSLSVRHWREFKGFVVFKIFTRA